jgi:clorobiocin/coumermycin A biosynthesis protein CloN6/CouN6
MRTHDLVLLHAPRIYDFRKINYVFSPYLIRKFDVAVTSMQEMHPLGLEVIRQYLSEHGFKVKIVNIASMMLKNADIDVRRILSTLKARLFGIDLQWIVHAQGALALAEDVKNAHPRTPIVFGGLTASYYHKELIGYRQADFVLRGYDTLRPLRQLIRAVKENDGFTSVPNLTYKDKLNSIKVNEFSYAPDTMSCWIDWSKNRESRNSSLSAINLLSGAGCKYDCIWCGGSASFYRNIMERNNKNTAIYRRKRGIIREIKSMGKSSNLTIYTHGYWHEDKDHLISILKNINRKIKVYFEVFHLLKKETIGIIKRHIDKPIFSLTLGSHDSKIRHFCGCPAFSTGKLEKWIKEVLGKKEEIRIWFYVGLPYQTPRSVDETAEYCIHLMEKFRGQRILPVIQPLVTIDRAAGCLRSRKDSGINYYTAH